MFAKVTDCMIASGPDCHIVTVLSIEPRCRVASITLPVLSIRTPKMTDTKRDAAEEAPPSHGILSDRVSRALQVRTDTPAMRAALEALAGQQQQQQEEEGSSSSARNGRRGGGGGASSSSSSAGNASHGSVVDARSVREAMERDAFATALQLQSQVRVMVEAARLLRRGASEIAGTAARVREAVHSPVITCTDHLTELPQTTNTEAAEEEQQPGANSLEQEQHLAASLYEAFRQTQAARHRYEAVCEFLDTFDVSAEDRQLLEHYDFSDLTLEQGHAVPDQAWAFLKALQSVRKIRQQLQTSFRQHEWTEDLLDSSERRLSSGQEDPTGVGAGAALRMMEGLAQQQERAYERLYQWLSQRIAEDEETVLLTDYCRTAVYTLKQVPAFYTHCLELSAHARRTAVTRRFLLALTSGIDDAPPMEMKAHDSVAYVGDMLAFSFKAFSVEADIAKGLLDYQPEGEEDEAVNPQEEKDEDEDPSSEFATSEKAMTAADILSISTSGLARPLKSRIMQVISSLSRRPGEDHESDDGMEDDLEEEGNLVRTRIKHLYSICGLLLFYQSVALKGVQKLESREDGDERATLHQEEKNPLVDCFATCLDEACTAYEGMIRVYGAMLDQLSVMTGDSEASLVRAMLELLAETRTHSPGFSSDVECPERSRRILSMEWVTETLVEASTCRTLDDVVALKQSLAASREAGMSELATEKLAETIEEKERSLINELVVSETTQVLDLCGLGSLEAAWKRWKETEGEGILMATFPGLSAEDVEAGIREFYTSLFSPPIPSLEHAIKDPVARKAARSKIANNVCQTYADLYASISSSGKGGYSDVSFLGHTPEQVTTLFSV